MGDIDPECLGDIIGMRMRGTVYAAIRNLNKETGAGYVFCAVILFKNSGTLAAATIER